MLIVTTVISGRYTAGYIQMTWLGGVVLVKRILWSQFFLCAQICDTHTLCPPFLFLPPLDLLSKPRPLVAIFLCLQANLYFPYCV